MSSLILLKLKEPWKNTQIFCIPLLQLDFSLSGCLVMDEFQTFDWNMDSMWFNQYLFYLQCSVWTLCSMLYLGMLRHASNLPSGFGTEYLFLLRLHSVFLGGSVCLLYNFLIRDSAKDTALLCPTQGSSTRAAKSCAQPDVLTSKPFEVWFGSVSKSWDAFLKLIQTYLRLFGLGIGLKPMRIGTFYFLIPRPGFLHLHFCIQRPDSSENHNSWGTWYFSCSQKDWRWPDVRSHCGWGQRMKLSCFFPRQYVAPKAWDAEILPTWVTISSLEPRTEPCWYMSPQDPNAGLASINLGLLGCWFTLPGACPLLPGAPTCLGALIRSCAIYPINYRPKALIQRTDWGGRASESQPSQ